ncbi:hypothetical protein HPB47_005153 [Ixodes persulcatus]|uniref:Uncharacterized protein n=1 Tax=Ixodes persulcatus TaxID=34615 RepID=A0AC60PF13_IXOPE|nr:hypothetical protein HPB47_005153 [Ixodes persulcatus]
MDDANLDWEPTQNLGYERGEQPLGEISAPYQRSKKRQEKAVQSDTSTPPCQSLQDRASPQDRSMDPEPDRSSPPPSSSVDSAASNTANSVAPQCEQASPAPAMQVQSAVITLPTASASNQAFSGASRSHWEWLT